MIHGIYLNYNPDRKGLWFLASATISAEIALKDKETVLKEAIKEGNKEARVAIKTFQSLLDIPEVLKDIQENEKLLYN